MIVRKEKTQIEKSLTDNKKREKTQTENSTTRKMRNTNTQKIFKKSKKVEYATKKTMKKIAYEKKIKKMNLTMMLSNLSRMIKFLSITVRLFESLHLENWGLHIDVSLSIFYEVHVLKFIKFKSTWLWVRLSTKSKNAFYQNWNATYTFKFDFWKLLLNHAFYTLINKRILIVKFYCIAQCLKIMTNQNNNDQINATSQITQSKLKIVFMKNFEVVTITWLNKTKKKR